MDLSKDRVMLCRADALPLQEALLMSLSLVNLLDLDEDRIPVFFFQASEN